MNQPSNPFPGLRPFLTRERHLFFGRERQVAELVDRLGRTRFLAVVGTSGSGKSSLVRAGLLPELHGGNMVRAGTRWEVAVMRPGAGPMHNLARALLEGDLYDAEQPDASAALLATLNRSRFGLVEAVRQSEVEPGTNFLVIVDQFEEIFRFHSQTAPGDEHAVDFINLLLEATRQDAVPIFVVLTMRSDFLGDCAVFSGLAEAVNEGEYLIPRMDRDQCQLAIEGPARVGGAGMAPRLVQRLLNEIGDDPDQLPVLQHALMRTWDHWSGRTAAAAASARGGTPIDLEDYQEVGGMTEALSRHADEVYSGLPNDRQRRLAERLFRALTERGADARGVRRPVRLDRLAEIVDATSSEVIEVIEAFRAAGRTFLMPMEPAELRPETVVDISHESLMRVWQRLRAWVDEEAQSARIYRRLAETASLHAEGKAGLYRDPDLQIAWTWREKEEPTAAWAARYHDGFAAAMGFLQGSAEARRAEEAAREAARLRELEQAKALAEAERRRAEEQARSAKRLRVLVRALGLVTLVAIWATVIAIAKWGEAGENARAAQVKEQLARASEGRAKAATVKAQALQAEAARQGYVSVIGLAESQIENGRNQDARQTLLEDVPEHLRHWEYGHLMHRATARGVPLDTYPGWAWGPKFSPDGKLLTSRSGGELRTHDSETGALLYATNLVSRAGEPAEYAFAPEGRRMAVTSMGTTGPYAWIQDARTGALIKALDVPSPCASVAFSPDGRWLAVGGKEPDVLLYDSGSGAVVRRFSGHGDIVRQIAFTRDGLRLITVTGKWGVGDLNREARARVWEFSSGKLLQEFSGHADGIVSLALHPSEPWMVTGGWERTIRAWDLETGRERWNLPVSFGFVGSLKISPNGRLLFASGERTVDIYTLDDLRPFASIPFQSWFVTSLDLSPDGKRLATADTDNAVRIIDLSRIEDGLPLAAHRRAISALAASPDGQRVATGGWDGLVHLWEVRGWKLLRTLDAGRGVTTVEFSPEGTGLLTLGTQGKALLWNVESGQIEREYSSPSRTLLADAALAPDGHSLATLNGVGRVTLFDQRSGSVLWHRQAHPYLNDGSPALIAVSIRFSPDGRRLVTSGAADSTARVLDAATGQELGVLTNSASVRFACFTPDGASIMTSEGAAGAATVRFWDAATFALTRTLRAPEGVGTIDFSEDGRRFLTSEGPFDLQAKATPGRVWDTTTGRPLLVLGDTNSMARLIFLPRTSVVLGADTSGSVRFWNALPWRELPSPDTATNRMATRPDSRDIETNAFVDVFDLSLGQVAALKPASPSFTTAVQASIKPRDPSTSPLLLDLSRHYTGGLSLDLPRDRDPEMVESRLGGLLEGVQVVDGVRFDIRGLLVVTTNITLAAEPGALKASVTGVPVGRAFQRLHALQGLVSGSSSVVARYRVHYVDGSEASIPVNRPDDVDVITADGITTSAAWRGWAATDRFLRLYHQVWENPRPDAAVAHIDVEAAGGSDAVFFTVALTVETNSIVKIQRPSQSQRVALRQSAEFRVEIKSAMPVVYQWLHDGEAIPGATNDVLRLDPVAADHAGSYAVRMTVADGGDVAFTESAPATLEVESGSWLRGGVRMEFYADIPGRPVSNLVANAKFPNRPDSVKLLRSLEAPWNQGDNFGLRISGYLVPPITGEYVFYVASDDQSQLFLSPSEDPAAKELIAQEPIWQSPRAWIATRRRAGTPNISRPIRLESGRRYYIEGLMKEGIVGDHFAVAWQLPGQTPPRNGDPPIPGRYLEVSAAWFKAE